MFVDHNWHAKRARAQEFLFCNPEKNFIIIIIIIIINKLQVGWHPVAVIEYTEYT